MTDILHLLDIAEHAALEAGKAVMEIYRSGSLEVRLKPDASPFTKADGAAQSIIAGHLAVTGLPVLSEEAAGAVYRQRVKWGYFWLVDPLDGTNEFIGGRDEYTVNIALMHKTAPVGGVVHAPARDTTYVGSKPGGLWKRTGDKKRRILPAVMRPHIQDLRQKEKVTCVVSRSHLSKETMEIVKQFGDVTLVPMGSSLKFMALIEQQADIYPRIGVTMEWDIAAAHAILHAANRGIYQTDFLTELAYNKRDLRNPYFIAF